MTSVDLPKGVWTEVATGITSLYFQVKNINNGTHEYVDVAISYGGAAPTGDDYFVERVEKTDYFGVNVNNATNVYAKALNVDAQATY